MADRQFYVYLLASRIGGTLYCGITSNLVGRIWQHKNHVAEGFSKRYAVTRLVWYEIHATVEAAITREKQIKEWRRAWKIQMIEEHNPRWLDLYPYIST